MQKLATYSRREVLEFFKFDGKIHGSSHMFIPREKLRATFGSDQGNVLADELAGYHPPAGLELTLDIVGGDAEDACLKATRFAGAWNDKTKKLFASLEFVPSPSGFKFLVSRKLDPAVHNVGVWVLNYVKIEGGPNPYSPEMGTGDMSPDDPRVHKVILVWSLEGFNEYVFTCWRWD